MTMTIDGKELELRSTGPASKAVYVDGVVAEEYALNFDPSRAPTERQQADFLRGVRRMIG